MNKQYGTDKAHVFGKLMCEKAGVEFFENANERKAEGPESQPVVDVLVDYMLDIRARKVSSYGDRRYKYLRSRNLELAMWFCDLQRKMDRLEAMIFENDESTNEDLIDAASDMAGYGIMGLELMFYLWAQNEGERV